MYPRTGESPTGSVATTARVDHYGNGALAIRMSSHLASRTLTVFRILFQELNRSLVATHRYEAFKDAYGTDLPCECRGRTGRARQVFVELYASD
jgi:hypothetical protein